MRSQFPVPTPFRFGLEKSYMNATEDNGYCRIYNGNLEDFYIPEKYDVQDNVFYLNLGKNMEKIDFVSKDEYYPHINEGASVTFYHPVVHVECSQEN